MISAAGLRDEWQCAASDRVSQSRPDRSACGSERKATTAVPILPRFRGLEVAQTRNPRSDIVRAPQPVRGCVRRPRKVMIEFDGLHSQEHGGALDDALAQADRSFLAPSGPRAPHRVLRLGSLGSDRVRGGRPASSESLGAACGGTPWWVDSRLVGAPRCRDARLVQELEDRCLGGGDDREGTAAAPARLGLFATMSLHQRARIETTWSQDRPYTCSTPRT